MKWPEKEAMVASCCRIQYYLIVKAFSRIIIFEMLPAEKRTNHGSSVV